MKNLHLNENEYPQYTPPMETDDLSIKQNNIQADTDYFSNAKGITNATNNFIIPQPNTQTNKDNNDDVYHKPSVYSNFFSEHVSIFERGYRISNLILIKACILLIFHYYFLISYTGILWNIYIFIGLILTPSVVIFPLKFNSLIKERQCKHMAYSIGLYIGMLILTALNYAFTFYPSIIGQELYDYCLVSTNKKKIYAFILIVEGFGLLSSMILLFIYSDIELASLKTPLLS